MEQNTTIAIGASATLAVVDKCTEPHDTAIGTVHCVDDTVASLSGTIDSPFAFAATGDHGTVTATDVGDAVLHLEAHATSGKTFDWDIEYHARRIHRVEVEPICDPFVSRYRPTVATGTTFSLEWSAESHDYEPLVIHGLSAPLVAHGITLEGTPSSPQVSVSTGTTIGTARITSPEDPDLSFEVDVVDRSSIVVEGRYEGPAPRRDSTIHVRVGARAAQRSLCVLPGGGWTVQVTTPSLCHISSGKTSFSDEPVSFDVYADAIGICRVQMSEPTHLLDDTVDIRID
jgi:hypothetical protein